MNDDKIKVLDIVGTSVNKSEKIVKVCNEKKIEIKFRQSDGKIRFIYGDNIEQMELFLKSKGSTILEVEKMGDNY